MEFSKRLIADIRALLWVVTVGGLVLAAYCIRRDYAGALPWLTAMVGLPWTAHGTVCAFYLNMAKSDHRGGRGSSCNVNSRPTRSAAPRGGKRAGIATGAIHPPCNTV